MDIFLTPTLPSVRSLVLLSPGLILLPEGDAVRALSVLLLAAAVLLSAGCEGEQGPVGPSGNANVVTGTISPTSEEWLWNSTYWFRISPNSATGYFTRYVDIPVAEITSDIISAGAVLVSFEANTGSGSWTPLPFQFVEGSAQYIFNVVYEVMEGTIRLHFFFMNNSAGVTPPDLQTYTIATYTFKYTVIEGNLLETMTARGVDISDHDQVMDYLAP
jgi:hypothetical protein